MDLQRILYFIPGIVIGLTIHEFCHALCAYKLGDSTAREQGRLTLNPIKHIDIIGFLFIIFAGFGWAKPVMFNPENLKNLRRDRALIAAAGPLSNLVMGILLCLLIRILLSYIDSNSIRYTDILFHVYFIIYIAASINFGLFIFNLLPIPPLDGSHIVFSGLNLNHDVETKIRKIGLPILFLILIIQRYLKITIIPIGIIIDWLMGIFV